MKKMILAFVAIFAIFSIPMTPANAMFGREEAIYNVQDSVIKTLSGKELTLEQVEVLISAAVTAKEWTPTHVGDGHLQADIHVRQHYAKVDIKFTTKTFSITYNDSKELLYSGTKIHRNYNKWVKLLAEKINEKLLAA